MHIPLGRALSFPGPEKPARAAFIRVELCLDEMPQVRLVVSGESGYSARILPGAAAGYGEPWQRAIVASASAKSVEPFRTTKDRQSAQPMTVTWVESRKLTLSERRSIRQPQSIYQCR